MTEPHTLSTMKRTRGLVPSVTELLQLVASLGLELDGLANTSHPFLHYVLMLHLCDRVAKVNRRVRSTLLGSLPIHGVAVDEAPRAEQPIASSQEGV